MQRSTGGRFTARLVHDDEQRACFDVQLTTAAGTWSSPAEVRLDAGSVAWGAWNGPGAPPPWLCHYAQAALRSAWRDRARLGWPRRLTRWREAPSRERPFAAGGKE